MTPLSRTALRIGCSVGAVLCLVGVALIIVGVAGWQPLGSAPAWLTTLSSVVVVVGIATTVIFSAALARRDRR
ncbi:hypothetical protein DBR36_00025 [Microbacterium sp. HMWF026]|uniref:hypothetical protein n=1 Tax=Microbacterium sp. HMWF026 TaxID=2056861 RepID=UPI000D338B38|nr:hypothetical protein [Microbacterium sp. HMWF026]PTT23305.1 hypothetical protein DBR36_00025 [Microbacterium sp. HMWF026]